MKRLMHPIRNPARKLSSMRLSRVDPGQFAALRGRLLQPHRGPGWNTGSMPRGRAGCS